MKRFLATAAFGAALVAGGGSANAQSIIREPGLHDSSVEVEVHGFVDWGGWAWRWGGYAIGPGFRVGIPLARNAFVPSINNDVRINFGADFYFWPNYDGYGNTFWWINSPVVLQWNFFLTGHWSVFAEAGAALSFYPYGVDGVNCYDHGPRADYYCDVFGILPAFAGGARYHFGGNGRFPTLTMRLGFPTGFNIGVSF